MNEYQLWIQYTVQDADAPRSSSEWTLHSITDNLEDIFIKKVEAEQRGDKTMVTQQVTLKVEVTAGR